MIYNDMFHVLSMSSNTQQMPRQDYLECVDPIPTQPIPINPNPTRSNIQFGMLQLSLKISTLPACAAMFIRDLIFMQYRAHVIGW